MSPRAPAAALALAAGLAAAATPVACSTVAPPQTQQQCDDEEKCPEGEDCYKGVCYPNDLPERELIALDVRTVQYSGNDATFRVELVGNDAAIERILVAPKRYRVALGDSDGAPGVQDTLELRLRELFLVPAPGEQEIAGTLTLRQPSRIGRAPLVAGDSPQLRYPALDPMTGLPRAGAPAVQPWPHYDPGYVLGNQPLLVEVSPQDDQLDEDDPNVELYTRGLVYRQLVRQGAEGVGTEAFTITSVRECHRELTGILRFPGGQPPLPPLLPGDGVTLDVGLRHAGGRSEDGRTCDPEAQTLVLATCSPATVEPQPDITCTTSESGCPDPYVCLPHPSGGKKCGCASDDHCPSGQVCDLEGQRCALDLTDLPATKPGSITPPLGDGEAFRTTVYTYCDEDPEKPREMEFVISASPDARTGLPRLSFRAVLDFAWNGGVLTPPTLKPLCMPSWQPAQTVQIDLAGPPLELWRDRDERPYVCCATDCLVGDGPPIAPNTCAVKGNIGVTGTFALSAEEQDAWAAAACLPLHGADEAGAVRVAYKSGSCPPDMPCSVSLSAGVPGGAGQVYDLRIEPPVGSIFRSTTETLTVDDQATQAGFLLGYRVLLRGRVTIDPEECEAVDTGDPEDCLPEAEVLAERVHLAEEDADPPLGPYFYTANSRPDADGEFILPVNPGVYLVTALPRVGTGQAKAGPAPIVALDLREGSPLVRDEGGVLVADLADDLRLGRGAAFTIELDDFDASSRVMPLDLTSWEGLRFQGELLRLSDPGTCYPLFPEGCQIRRLRPGNSPAQLTQEQFINYTTRQPP